MICILEIDEHKEIKGWIIATDLQDARRQLPFDDRDLAAVLSRMEVEPPTGKHQLSTGHLMLVS